MSDFDVFGVYVPALLALALVTYVVHLVLRRGLGRLGLYRFVWHRALFDMALYVVLLGGINAVSLWFVS